MSDGSQPRASAAEGLQYTTTRSERTAPPRTFRAMVRQRVSAGTRRACSMGKLCAYGGNVCNICSFRPYKLMLSENHLHLKFLEEGKNIDLCSLWTVFSPPALAARGVEWQVSEVKSRGASRLVLATCSVQQAQRSAF